MAATTNRRTEIRNEIKNQLVSSGKFAGYTIQKTRMLSMPNGLLPAIIIFGGKEIWDQNLDRSGYDVNGDILIRILLKAKLPPEELNTGELYADDELDATGKLIEETLIQNRFPLAGLCDVFKLSEAYFGFTDSNESDTLAYITYKFDYIYKVAFSI